jgi:hypothetical protein
MPEGYEVTSVREITDVDSETGDLLDYIEASAKSQPHGVTFTIRAPAKNFDPNALSAELAAKAAQLESVFGI